LTGFDENRYDRVGDWGGSIPHVEPATRTRATKAGGDARGVAASAAPAGDAAIRSASSAYDWDRLERAVGALAVQHEALRNEVRALRGDLGERNQRIRVLEAQLLEANQRRQDTCKRVDELIAQLDQLDAQLESAEPAE
jgi:phage shock protein A